VQDKLSAKFTSASEAKKNEQGALVEYYAVPDQHLLWVDANGLTDRGKTVMAEIEKADDYGLRASDYALPDPQRALANPPGLAGIVHDLSLPTLLAAYRRGLFPLAHIAPLKWWSPPQRSLLFFRNFHISNNLARLMRQGHYSVTFDRDFDAVIAACAGRREGRWHLTWITPRIMRAYAEAFDAGHAHSFEVWNKAGELAAGGYGIAIGGSFTAESQFTHQSNASRIGMTVLNWHLAHWGYRFNDGKLIGPLWENMGFRDVPRHEFLALLAEALRDPGKSGRWQVEADLDTVSYWQPGKV
jgi:leucyl/phenylalanyl-tRNA--protein transferase